MLCQEPSCVVGPFRPIGRLEKVEEKSLPLGGHSYFALGSDLASLDDSISSWRKEGRSGCGYSLESQESAQYKAVGEALEWYAGSYYCRHNPARWDTALRLKAKKILHVPPELFPQFIALHDSSSEQYFHSFGSETKTSWSKGFTIDKNNLVLVPSQYLLFPHQAKKEEVLVTQTTSNGVATHRSLTKAIWSAVKELCERESLLIHWWYQIKPKRIKNSSYTPLLKNLEMRLQSLNINLQLYLFESALNLKTVLAVILEDSTSYLPFIAGHACSPNMVSAAHNAVEELMRVFNTVNHESEREKYLKMEANYKSVRRLSEHSLFYCHPNNINYMIQFLDNKAIVALEEQNLPNEDDEDETIKNFYFQHIEEEFPLASYIDFTPPDLRRNEFFVVRVVLPQIAPLTFGQPIGFWKNQRIESLAKKWGGEKELETISPLPHFIS